MNRLGPLEKMALFIEKLQSFGSSLRTVNNTGKFPHTSVPWVLCQYSVPFYWQLNPDHSMSWLPKCYYPSSSFSSQNRAITYDSSQSTSRALSIINSTLRFPKCRVSRVPTTASSVLSLFLSSPVIILSITTQPSPILPCSILFLSIQPPIHHTKGRDDTNSLIFSPCSQNRNRIRRDW